MDDRDDVFSKDFYDICHIFSLKRHVSIPTHKAGHTIDLILTREDDTIATIPIATTLFTDHYVVQAELNLPRKNFELHVRKTRPIKDINLENFKRDIKSGCDTLLQQTESKLDDIVNGLNSLLISTLDKHAPVVTKISRVRPKKCGMMMKYRHPD